MPFSAPAELGPATLGPDVMFGPQKCPAMLSVLADVGEAPLCSGDYPPLFTGL